MPVPLHADAEVLGKVAVKSAPRFAALLMASSHSGSPLMSTMRPVGAPPELATFLTSGSPLTKWCSQVESGQRALSLTKVAPVKKAVAAPAKRNIFSPIRDVYSRLDDEGGGESRLHTIDEEAESLAPAAPGETSRVMATSDRNTEMLAVAAAIVGTAYGDQVSRKFNGGSFDVTVFGNVLSAANTIAPGKSLSSLSAVELKAVVTSAIQGSNSAFLQSVGGAPRSLVDATKNSSDGGKVAGEFMKNGAFSESMFLAKTQGTTMGASQLMAATPMGAKMALLMLAAEKASELMPELGKKSGWLESVKERMRDSVAGRLQMLDHPGESDGAGEDEEQRKRKRTALFEKPAEPGAP